MHHWEMDHSIVFWHLLLEMKYLFSVCWFLKGIYLFSLVTSKFLFVFQVAKFYYNIYKCRFVCIYPVEGFVCSSNLINSVSLLLDIISAPPLSSYFSDILENYLGHLILCTILQMLFHIFNLFSLLCYTFQILLLIHLLSLSWHLLFNSSIVKYLFLEIHFMLRVHVWYFTNSSVPPSYFFKQ